MSAPETERTEAKSSVEISRTAKGDPTFKVKAYDGCEEPELDRIRSLAIDSYRDLEREFYGRVA